MICELAARTDRHLDNQSARRGRRAYVSRPALFETGAAGAGVLIERDRPNVDTPLVIPALVMT